MLEKLFGGLYLLMGIFVIFVAATSRTPDGHPLTVSWFISIIGILLIELGIITLIE